jgi:hypothetical protein
MLVYGDPVARHHVPTPFLITAVLRLERSLVRSRVVFFALTIAFGARRRPHDDHDEQAEEHGTEPAAAPAH